MPLPEEGDQEGRARSWPFSLGEPETERTEPAGTETLRRILGRAHTHSLVRKGIILERLLEMSTPQLNAVLDDLASSDQERRVLERQISALRHEQADGQTTPASALIITLGQSAAVGESDLEVLAGAKIHEFDDWLRRGDTVRVSRQGREALDSHARFARLGVYGGVVDRLRENGIASPIDLLEAEQRGSRDWSRNLGIARGEREDLLRRARGYREELSRAVLETQIHQDSGISQPFQALHKQEACDTCSPHETVFSRFAYFLHLVGLTELSLTDLDARLHQAFMQINAASGLPDARMRQLEICIDVLKRAYPGQPTAAQRWRYDRHYLRAKLQLIPVSLVEFFHILLARLSYTDDGQEAAMHGLGMALEALPLADLESEEPQLSAQEHAAVYVLLEEMYLVRQFSFLNMALDTFIAAALQLNPALGGPDLHHRFDAALKGTYATDGETFNAAERQALQTVADQHLTADGLRLLVEPIRQARDEALPALRDAYKRHADKSDRELYAELFIETDLPACERITPLDQAIRTLQAFLRHLSNEAIDPAERRAYEFEPYDAWRVSRMAAYYPELRALWKDDVLTGEADFWDRGSIILDQAHNHVRLEATLVEVRELLMAVRVNVGKDAMYFYENPEQIDSGQHAVPFRDLPQSAMFMEGLDAIEEVLQADALIQQGLRALDMQQPGIAIDHYHRALVRLEELAALLFNTDSPWDFAGRRGTAVYRELQALHPRDYWLGQIDLHARLLGSEKRLFRDRLIPSSGQFTIVPDHWAFPHWAFSLQLPNVIRHIPTGESQNTRHRCYYAEAGTLSNYRFTGRIRYSGGYLKPGEHLGVGARMSTELGNQRGYAVIVVAKTTVGQTQEVATSDVLRLLKINSDGAHQILWESEMIICDPDTEYNVRLRCRNLLEDNQLVATGLVAEFQRTGAPMVSPEILDETPFAEGTFGFYCSARRDARFVPVVEVSAVQQTASPPFYAPRRQALTSWHLLTEGNRPLQEHYTSAAPLALDTAAFDIVQPTTFVRFERLAGLKTAASGGSVDQYLLFRGQKRVSLDTLDLLLEHLLMRSYHLRFGVLPMRLGQAFFQAGDYATAADYFRMLYDDRATPGGPPMPGFEDPKRVYPLLSRPPDTLAESVSQDAKLMRLRLGEVYLAWADWLFQKNSDQSRYEARRLYERVLAMYGDAGSCECFPALGEAFELVNVFAAAQDEDEAEDAQSGLAVYEDLVERYDEVLNNGWNVAAAVNRLPTRRPASGETALQERRRGMEDYVRTRRQQTARQFQLSAVEQRGTEILRAAESRYLRSSGALFHGGAGAGQLLFGFGISVFWMIALCVPGSPVKGQQIRHACHMLGLLRSCRNVLGFPQDASPQYRFESLFALAQSHASLAKDAERDLLQFRKELETATLAERNAENNVLLSHAQLAQEDLNVAKALEEVRLANLQRIQAHHSLGHYEKLLREGWTTAEKIAFGTSAAAAALSAVKILPVLVSGTMSIAKLAGGTTATSTGGGAAVGVPLAALGVLSGLGTVVGALSKAAEPIGSTLGKVSSTAAMYASFERREQEWRFQTDKGRRALAVASQSLTVAGRRVDIALQARYIASLRGEFAGDTYAFLTHRFLNSAMWLWLQNEIRKEYQLRLHYAITVAHMAERAAAFETQDQHINAIGFDYYDPRRDGLLGATKLQTDLATLRQLRLHAEQHKLQLTRVLSLASLLPLEFERFRRTGTLRFRTLQEWFDEDFPGHYLRLIRTVRVTVLIATPPPDGIRATLRCSGVSTVVVEADGVFSEQLVRREPQSVAFTATAGATGLFELRPDGLLLLPFEGLGVETDWALELPKRTNPFDGATLADVLLEIDYTALESPLYRQTVLQRQGSRRSVDLALSAKLHFPEVWEQFLQPEDGAVGQSLIMTLETEHLSPRLNPGTCRAYHLTLVILGRFTADDAGSLQHLFRITKDDVVLTSSETPGAGEQQFLTVVNEPGAILLSTRLAGHPQGAGSSVTLDLAALGAWQIDVAVNSDMPTDGGTATIVEQIEDIVLVVSLRGQIHS